MADTDASTDTTVDDDTTADQTQNTEDSQDVTAEMASAWKKRIADAKSDAAKAKAEAAKYHRELEKLRTDALSDNERAVAIARAEGITEGTKAGAARLVDAEVRAAAAGRNVDVKALLEGLDRSRFIDDDGEPNTDRIARWVDRIAPVQEQTQPGAPRVPTGPRGPANQTRPLADQFGDWVQGQLNQS